MTLDEYMGKQPPKPDPDELEPEEMGYFARIRKGEELKQGILEAMKREAHPVELFSMAARALALETKDPAFLDEVESFLHTRYDDFAQGSLLAATAAGEAADFRKRQIEWARKLERNLEKSLKDFQAVGRGLSQAKDALKAYKEANGIE